jgi:hypothetical protein
MAYEKAEIIKAVYDEQALDTVELKVTAQREAYEHDGAAQAMLLLGKQMPSFASQIEQRIVADTEMSPGEANVARIYAKNMIARFQTMCVENAKNQRNSKLRCEGQISMLEKQRDTLTKKGDLAIAKAKRRAEVEKEEAEKTAKVAKDALKEKKKAPAKKAPAKKGRVAKIAAAAKKTNKKK